MKKKKSALALHQPSTNTFTMLFSGSLYLFPCKYQFISRWAWSFVCVFVFLFLCCTYYIVIFCTQRVWERSQLVNLDSCTSALLSVFFISSIIALQNKTKLNASTPASSTRRFTWQVANVVCGISHTRGRYSALILFI